MKKLIDILALLAFFIFWILIYVGIVMYLNKRYIPDYLFGLAFYSLLAGLGFLSVSVFLGIFSFLIKKAVHKHWFRFILKKLNIRYPKAIGLWLKGVISFIEGCFSHPGGGIPNQEKG